MPPWYCSSLSDEARFIVHNERGEKLTRARVSRGAREGVDGGPYYKLLRGLLRLFARNAKWFETSLALSKQLAASSTQDLGWRVAEDKGSIRSPG